MPTASSATREREQLRKKHPHRVPVQVCWKEGVKPLRLLMPEDMSGAGFRKTLLAKGVPENVLAQLVAGNASVPVFDRGGVNMSVKQMDNLYKDAEGYLSLRPGSRASARPPAAHAPDQQAEQARKDRCGRLEEGIRKAQAQCTDMEKSCAEVEQKVARMEQDLQNYSEESDKLIEKLVASNKDKDAQIRDLKEQLQKASGVVAAADAAVAESPRQPSFGLAATAVALGAVLVSRAAPAPVLVAAAAAAAATRRIYASVSRKRRSSKRISSSSSFSPSKCLQVPPKQQQEEAKQQPPQKRPHKQLQQRDQQIEARQPAKRPRLNL